MILITEPFSKKMEKSMVLLDRLYFRLRIRVRDMKVTIRLPSSSSIMKTAMVRSAYPA